MTIPPAIIREALTDALQRQIDELQLVSIKQAAALMNVSPLRAKSILGRGVDVGGKGYKVRLSEVRKAIEQRTIKL